MPAIDNELLRELRELNESVRCLSRFEYVSSAQTRAMMRDALSMQQKAFDDRQETIRLGVRSGRLWHAIGWVLALTAGLMLLRVFGFEIVVRPAAVGPASTASAAVAPMVMTDTSRSVITPPRDADRRHGETDATGLH